MKYGYKEIRKIYADDLRNLCYAKNWYTRGDSAEYSHLIYDMADRKENITTDDIVEIAQDIIEHSNIYQSFASVTNICFDIAKIAVTYFKKV